MWAAQPELCRSFSGNGYSMSAFDFDPEMVRLASEKVGSTGLFTLNSLICGPWELISRRARSMVCFVLGYLGSSAIGRRFINVLSAAFNVLKPGGTLAIQILNYDFILESSMTRLPLIENETIRFERYYEFSSGQAGPLVDFITKLTIKKDSLVLDNRCS
jgi:SAM-dependent methyltransferase